MDLNKLTKKELINYAESLEIFVDKDETKAEIISWLNRYTFAKCEGCEKEIIDPPSANSCDESKRMYYVIAPDSRSHVELCEVCYNEWSDVPKGYKLEVNKSNGGLWYRPLSKRDKKNIKEDTFFERWMMYFFVFAGIWLAIGISAFISDIFGLGFGDDIRRITWHIYNPFSDSINPYP